jgi:hypothetical protein
MLLADPVTHPADLDYDWYHREALKIAVAVGCAEYLTPAELALITPPPRKRKNGNR